MNRRLVRQLLAMVGAVGLVALLAGCGDDSPPASVPDDFMVDVESPIHDIRAETLEAWANSMESYLVWPLTQDRQGWSYSWRVGGGEIIGATDSSIVVWRTPLDTLSWIEATLSRGGESHLCRRWLALRLEALNIQLQVGQQEHGMVYLYCDVPFFPRTPLAISWGAEAGRIHSYSNGLGATWDLCRAGPHRVWAQVDDGLRQAADTLVVTMPNAAPEYGPASGDQVDIWTCGTMMQITFRGADANRDSLSLEILALEGLSVEGVEHVEDPSNDDYQYAWGLQLRDSGQGAGLRSLRLRLSDGLLANEQTFQFWITCP